MESPHNDITVASAQPDISPFKQELFNPTSSAIVVHSGTHIATMESVESPHNDITVASAQPDISPFKQEMLEQMVRQSEEHLTDSQRKQLLQLLECYSDVFANCKDDFGRTNRIQHQIPTGESAPIRQPVRRVPPAKRSETRELLQGMLEKDVIQPSIFCVDYRKVNSVTRKDAYPLPRVDDTLDTLMGAKWFTTLDLVSGYWQVEVHEDDQEKTAFCLFEFKVMPFGLCNAPATFQRLMDMILAGLQWTTCLIYLDDVIVLGRTFIEHLDHLEAVFSRLCEASLKLQPFKCNLCRAKVNFLYRTQCFI